MHSELYLYKILGIEDWVASEKSEYVHALPMDLKSSFIHLCEVHQIENIIKKYWHHEEQIVILELIPNKLLGNLVKEANHPKGTEYFHLYANGSVLPAIPHLAILRAVVVAIKNFSLELI